MRAVLPLLSLAIGLLLSLRRLEPVALVIVLAVVGTVARVLWVQGPLDYAGYALHWRNGVWQLERAGEMTPIALTPGTVVLPCAVVFGCRELLTGLRHRIWVFQDSCSSQQWRLLRIRLRLHSAQSGIAPGGMS